MSTKAGLPVFHHALIRKVPNGLAFVHRGFFVHCSIKDIAYSFEMRSIQLKRLCPPTYENHAHIYLCNLYGSQSHLQSDVISLRLVDMIIKILHKVTQCCELKQVNFKQSVL